MTKMHYNPAINQLMAQEQIYIVFGIKQAPPSPPKKRKEEKIKIQKKTKQMAKYAIQRDL